MNPGLDTMTEPQRRLMMDMLPKGADLDKVFDNFWDEYRFYDIEFIFQWTWLVLEWLDPDWQQPESCYIHVPYKTEDLAVFMQEQYQKGLDEHWDETDKAKRRDQIQEREKARKAYERACEAHERACREAEAKVEQQKAGLREGLEDATDKDLFLAAHPEITAKRNTDLGGLLFDEVEIIDIDIATAYPVPPEEPDLSDPPPPDPTERVRPEKAEDHARTDWWLANVHPFIGFMVYSRVKEAALEAVEENLLEWMYNAGETAAVEKASEKVFREKVFPKIIKGIDHEISIAQKEAA